MNRNQKIQFVLLLVLILFALFFLYFDTNKNNDVNIQDCEAIDLVLVWTDPYSHHQQVKDDYRKFLQENDSGSRVDLLDSLDKYFSWKSKEDKFSDLFVQYRIRSALENYGCHINRIHIVTYENEFPAQLDRQHPKLNLISRNTLLEHFVDFFSHSDSIRSMIPSIAINDEVIQLAAVAIPEIADKFILLNIPFIYKKHELKNILYVEERPDQRGQRTAEVFNSKFGYPVDLVRPMYATGMPLLLITQVCKDLLQNFESEIQNYLHAVALAPTSSGELEPFLLYFYYIVENNFHRKYYEFATQPFDDSVFYAMEIGRNTKRVRDQKSSLKEVDPKFFGISALEGEEIGSRGEMFLEELLLRIYPNPAAFEINPDNDFSQLGFTLGISFIGCALSLVYAITRFMLRNGRDRRTED